MNQDKTTDDVSRPVAGPVQRRVRRLPPKVMGEFPGMTPLEKLEADFRRLARVQRTYAKNRLDREGQSHMWSAYNAADLAYIVAAEKVRALRGVLTPNVELSGARAEAGQAGGCRKASAQTQG